MADNSGLFRGSLEPFYPRVGRQGGRPPYRLEVMLRIHLMQNWNCLSDEAMENDLIDIPCIRRFAGIDLVREEIPDATTILAFRHFLEKHHLGERIFQVVVEHLKQERSAAEGGHRSGWHHHSCSHF